MTARVSPVPYTAPDHIDDFRDVPVAIEARLGERLMDLSEIAAIEPGVVIPLQRAAGETLEVYVGDIRFALAEVVVIEDSLALRITKLDGLEQCLNPTAPTS